MIELDHVVKKYGKSIVIKEATGSFQDGKIYGLAGYNGVGKTTLLKTISGVFRPDGGRILADGEDAVGNSAFRSRSFLMTEELFFDPQSTLRRMKDFYRGYYPSWDEQIYQGMLSLSGLDEEAAIAGFSKGMQRQAGLILAVSTAPRFLFLDETFDGLDVVRRELLARILRICVDTRKILVIVTSHYLNELENMVDEIFLIEKGILTRPDTEGRSLEHYFTKGMEVSDEKIRSIFSKE